MGSASASTRENIKKSALRLKEDCLNSSKNNFLYSAILSKWRYFLGITSTVAAAFIEITVSTRIGSTNIIVLICSLVALLSSSIVTIWNPGKYAEMHQRIGNEYNATLKKCQTFIDVDICDENMSDKQLRETLDKLNNERLNLYKSYSNVIIPESIHKKVKKKLESGEANYGFEQNI